MVRKVSEVASFREMNKFFGMLILYYDILKVYSDSDVWLLRCKNFDSVKRISAGRGVSFFVP